jgi:hypothetical protein
MLQEIQSLIDRHNPDKITMRASESARAGSTYEHRIELEGAVYAAASTRGLKAVFKKRRSTIAKDLGLKGRARYLVTALDTSPLPDYETLSQKAQDAVQAAWSEL